MSATAELQASPLGPVPSDWRVVRVDEAGQVLGGRQRSPGAAGEPTKYLRVANVFDGYIDTSDVLEMPFTPAERERFALRDGDILLNEGQSLELVGRSAVFRGEVPGCVYQNTLIRFRANKGVVPEFVQAVFHRYVQSGVFAGIALQTTSIAHLGVSRLASLALPLPEEDEQQAIAEALGDVDAQLAAFEQLIAKKRDLKQAAMQQLLSGTTRLCGHGEPWDMRPLGKVCPLQRGFDLPTSELRPGPHPVVYSNGVLTHHATPAVRGPGVITGRSGTIGKVHFVGADFWPHNTSLWVTSFAGNCPRFIYYLLEHCDLSRFATGSGVPTLNRNDVHRHQVRVPPTFGEQEAIATALGDMDTELTALEARRDKTRLLKQGMMQALLTGRIRLT